MSGEYSILDERKECSNSGCLALISSDVDKGIHHSSTMLNIDFTWSKNEGSRRER